MIDWKTWLVTALCLLGVALQVRAEIAVFESCTDASGRTIPAEMDTSLKQIVRSSLEGGQRTIRYNPQILPRLSNAARQFFFAQECARLALGEQPGREPSAARARQADCLGVATLQGAGALEKPAAVAALQAELVFSDDEWSQLPGPRRSFDFPACPKRSALKLPPDAPPSAKLGEWDACVRICGDHLFRCKGEGCLATYNRCEAACKAE